MTSATKRGLGWPWDYPAAQISLFDSPNVSWLFNWELWRPAGLPTTIEWIPTVRTASQVNDIIPFLTDISTNQGVKITHLLGFNEPDIADKANMRVEEGVRLWKEFVLPAKEKFGCRLGSPGMSSDESKCFPWLDEFFKSQNGRDGVDFLVVHWYGERFSDMRRFLETVHSRYDLPIWVNEFACSKMGNGQASEGEVEAFIQEALPWLEGCNWIERYAFFGLGQGGDVGSWVGGANNFTKPAPGGEGKVLTKIGQLYIS